MEQTKYFSENYHKVIIEKHYDIYNYEVFNILKEKAFNHVPKIYELVKKEDELVVKEEYIEGENLEEYINKYSLTDNEVIDIIKQLCNILKPIHKCGIIHRDIKPSNIIYHDGTLTLIDFNGAKLLDQNKQRDTILLGTQGYAAPEQYGFGPSTIETDIYGIGSLIETLSENNPKFSLIIQKCHELNPKDRYHSLEELIRNLPVEKKKTSTIKLTKNPKYNKYLPVGFRSKKITHMIIAIIGYYIIFYAGLNLQIDDSKPGDFTLDLQTTKIIFIVVPLIVVYFNHNYLDIQDKLHIKKNKNKLLYVLKLVIIDYALAILIILLIVIIFSIFY